jgi:platelet-activating factor acetylhydrolase IB subunit alpha
VNNVSFHPEFSQLASSSDDATVKLWDIESGKFESTLKGHTGNVNFVTFDPTG